jgi:hypothetical protein
MNSERSFDQFPVWIPLLSNLQSLLIYATGILILLRASFAIAAIYLVFILLLEYRLISSHCVNCFYWGKTCGFGKGKVSALFFKMGDSAKFCSRKMTWKDMIPDLLVSLIPFTFGIILLIISFDIIILGALILMAVLSTAGNSYIRGSLTCRNCRQRELGCPAEELFRASGKNQVT